MSKRLKVIFSSLAVALIIALVSSLYPASPSYAYTGGLLNGKSMNYGPNEITINGTFSELTDNNETTSYSLGGYNSPSIKTLWYKFSEVASINAYQIKAITNKMKFSFYDLTGNLIGDVASPEVSGTKIDGLSFDNVSKIAITNTTNSAFGIYEVDFFGEEHAASTPTPEPTPTVTPEPSPSATPEVPAGGRAILTITLTTGLDKEFDLPISEVNEFLNWYDSTNGSARYGIDKHDNNKGPFSKRTEYVIHDKILTFEVSEYTAQ